MDAVRAVHGQRGAIGLMAAATLLIACLFLVLAVDGGRLYLEKRTLQRVADMAVLEAASRGGSCLGAAPTADGFARENARERNGFDPDVGSRSMTVACGRTDSSGARRTFIVDPSGRDIRVQVSEQVPASLILGGLFGEQVELSAQAVAARQSPVGRLALRSTLVSVDSERSQLLNALVGGLLGGSVNLQAGGWQGLLGTEVNLLEYLDLLALDLGLAVGNYQQVLQSDIALNRLLGVAASALTQAGSSTDLAASVAALNALALAVPAGSPLLRLSDILAVDSAVPAAGLDVGLNALQLAQALVQLANARNGLVAEVPLPLAGLTDATVSVQVIEPPQLSAIGDLNRARANPLDPASRIYVRTAQVRTLVSLSPGSSLTALGNAVNASVDSLVPVTGFLNQTLQLNLVDAIGNLLGGLICNALIPCPSTQTAAVQALAGNGRVDVSLDAGGAEAYVTDYLCDDPSQPSLVVQGRAALAHLRVGRLGDSVQEARQNLFNSVSPPPVQPLPVLLLGAQTVRPSSCLLTLCSGLKWKKGNNWIDAKSEADFEVQAGFGLRVDAPVAGSSLQAPPVTLASVPPLDQPPRYQVLATDAGQQLVNSLAATLSGVSIQAYEMASTNLLGALLEVSLGAVSSLLGELQSVLSGLLSPLLDPLLELLLGSLGVDLAEAEVGANMSCGFGSRLLI